MMTQLTTVNRFSIPKIRCEKPEDFLSIYAKERSPVIINGIIEKWPAFGKWSLDYFETTFPDLKLGPTVNLPIVDSPFESRWCDHDSDMTVKEFMEYMRSTDRPCYIHRKKIEYFPDAENDISFSEILPECDDQSENFLWIGSGGTRTGLHFDFQDTLLCQVHGKKSILLIPPNQSKYVYPYPDSVTKSRVVPEELDSIKYPNYNKANIFEGVIGPGQILYIPRQWWHSVVSLEPSISLSHNYGEKIKAKDLLGAIKAGGFLSWLIVAKDFVWYGIFQRKFKNRLFDDPPFGKLLYDILLSAIKRRIRPT